MCGCSFISYLILIAVLLLQTATVEQMKVLEKIADDTLVILQIHKRVWPTSQRDALFWSHVRRVPNDTDPDAQDIWIACNHSTEHPEAPV